MDENYKLIEEEIEKYNHTAVLCQDKVYILRGFHEDNDPLDGDYYYILQNIKGDFEHHSCVCGFIALKEQLNKKNYDKIRCYFQINLDKLAEEISQKVK